MPRPRKNLVNIDDTPFYHVTSRCVRRAFLCGHDAESGKNYDHRKNWLENRIRLLSSVFAIDICAYAVMSNHYHIVLKLAPEQVDSLTGKEVLKRWRCLYKGTLLVQRFLRGEKLTAIERVSLEQTIAIYRGRLSNLSWFMKCLNEPIARKANAEDGCTGHFWESRFSSQALLTNWALLIGMVYVDLNPIRAELANTPETSDYTSIKERIEPKFNLHHTIRAQLEPERTEELELKEKPLAFFLDDEAKANCRTEVATILPYTLKDYLNLVDLTGRSINPNKRGFIDDSVPPILQRLSISRSKWCTYATQFEELHRRGEFRLRS